MMITAMELLQTNCKKQSKFLIMKFTTIQCTYKPFESVKSSEVIRRTISKEMYRKKNIPKSTSLSLPYSTTKP